MLEQPSQPTQPDQPEPKTPTLDDVGTRYEHLQDHLEGLEAARDRLLSRGGNLSLDEKQRLVAITIAADVTRKTVEAFMGLNNTNVDYQLYRILSSVPAKADDIPGERGTPLCEK